MRPTKEFATLQATTAWHLGRLRAVCSQGCAALGTKGLTIDDYRQARRAVAYCTIEALNAWTNFVRSYYLSCILRPKRVTRGYVVYTNAAVTNFTEAIRLATGLFKPGKVPLMGVVARRDEPTWHEARVLMGACGALGCSHVTDIAGALSAPTQVLQHLPVFRNFVAHRNKESATAASSIAPTYTIPSRRHPIEILASPPSGRPFPLLVEWIDDLNVLVELLCD